MLVNRRITQSDDFTEVRTNQRKGKAERGRGQPDCFHGDWLSAMPLRGQRSLTRRSICHAASGGNQLTERDAKKRGPIRGGDGDIGRATGELRRGQVNVSRYFF